MSNVNATPTTPEEHKAIELRREGMSLPKIMAATGLPERRVRTLTKSVPKPKKPPKCAACISTPFARSVDRVFQLARRAHGIRDYELRAILHQEYGSTWDTTKGRYQSNYSADHIKRIKDKVKQRASEEDCNAIFTADWIDEGAPSSSFKSLASAALDLRSRADEYITEYITAHGTCQDDDSELAELARSKQRYSALRFLWKLAVPDYGKEPLDRLLGRSIRSVGDLEGNPDLELSTHDDTEKPNFYPEPSGRDHFLDYVEAEGWL